MHFFIVLYFNSWQLYLYCNSGSIWHTSSITLLHILHIYSEGCTVAIKKVPKHDLFLNHTVRSEVMQIRSVRAYLTTLSLPICKLWRKKKRMEASLLTTALC